MSLASSCIYFLFRTSCTDTCLLPHTTLFDASYSRSSFQRKPTSSQSAHCSPRQRKLAAYFNAAYTSSVSKSWKILLPPVSCVLQDVPQGDLKVLWPWQTFHQINFHYDLGALFQIIFHCVYHFFFILAPTDCHLFLRLSQACLPPSISCRGRRILSPWCSFVFVPSGPLRLLSIWMKSLEK